MDSFVQLECRCVYFNCLRLVNVKDSSVTICAFVVCRCDVLEVNVAAFNVDERVERKVGFQLCGGNRDS